MKKYINGLFAVLLAMTALSACSEDEGTEAGNDANPSVIVYTYEPTGNYNPDNDVQIRVATNSKVKDVYCLVEKSSEKEAHLSSLGEDGYADYVVSNGEKLPEVSGAADTDIVKTDLYGPYAITVVAVNGTKKSVSSAEFTGLDWADVVTGTYVFATTSESGTPSSVITGMTSSPTVLQVCTTNTKLYRFKDVFGEGYHMKINLIDYKKTDADGEYQFFRVPAAKTSFQVKGEALSVRDVGYWQQEERFA